MTCNLDDTAASALWPALLAARRALKETPGVRAWGLERCPDGWVFRPDGQGATVAVVPGAGKVPPPGRAVYRHDVGLAGGEPIDDPHGVLAAGERAVLRLYLPVVVGAWRARAAGRTFVTAHVAQSLDGRIACANGQSQWISNQANLHHSHRLRALHDAVLVGGRTVEHDDPQLTVRHVAGDDPRRVVLSASGAVLANGTYRVFTGAGSTVLVGAAAAAGLRPRPPVEMVAVPGAPEAGFPSRVVNDSLRARGHHSVFVEGGGTTVSRFLEQGALDLLHVHVAPMVIGSGVPSFRLPEITALGQARRFAMATFHLGGEVLLECRTVEETAR